MPPRTQYAKHGDLNIAYQVSGDGELDIVVVPSFVSSAIVGCDAMMGW